MDKSDIDNYAYFQEVWTSPKRYALVKMSFAMDMLSLM